MTLSHAPLSTRSDFDTDDVPFFATGPSMTAFGDSAGRAETRLVRAPQALESPVGGVE